MSTFSRGGGGGGEGGGVIGKPEHPRRKRSGKPKENGNQEKEESRNILQWKSS